jgi:hypothetical protein
MSTVPDIWSTVTGIASIASLLLALGDRFATWRRYLLPATAGLGGFALGRVSWSVESGVGQLGSGSNEAPVLLLLVATLLLIGGIAAALLRKGETWYAYILVAFALANIPGQVLSFYRERASADVTVEDHLAVAEIRAAAGDFSGARRHLEKAKAMAPSKELGAAIDRQLEVVARKQLERVDQLAPANPSLQPPGGPAAER